MNQLLKSIELHILNASDKFKGGSCASILIIHNYDYFIANIGDSRIIRVKLNDQKNIIIEQLTTDHKPENPTERKRIEKEGGKVYCPTNKISGVKG